jgi:hypothetical protein
MHSDSVKIESPCHESWDAMQGEGARRFCGVCQKDVHNLSAMGQAEARALLAASAKDSLCVRYSSEADGTLRFRDLVPLASLTRRIVRTALAAVALAACAPHGEAPLQGLGESIIESLREQATPSAAGGCDLTTGPFTTFHLPPGHALCVGVGEVSEPGVGELPEGRVPVIEAEPEREVMGAMIAEPGPKPALVPCDPVVEKPAVAPTERPIRKMGKYVRPTPEKRPRMGKPTLSVDDL